MRKSRRSVVAISTLMILMLCTIIIVQADPDPDDEDENQGGSGSSNFTGTWYVDSGDDLVYANQTVVIWSGNVVINSSANLTFVNATLGIEGSLTINGGGRAIFKRGATLIVQGDLIVNSRGLLNLSHSTLRMSCASEGLYKINIKKHGALNAHNTTFARFGNPPTFFNYSFECRGNISLVDCNISHIARTGMMMPQPSGIQLMRPGVTTYPMHCLIKRCHFFDNKGAGINVGVRKGPQIIGNSFHDQPTGIQAQTKIDIPLMNIHKNKFYNLSVSGITAATAFAPSPILCMGNITSNTFINCSRGISILTGLKDTTFRDNLFRDNIDILGSGGMGAKFGTNGLINVNFIHNRMIDNDEGINTSTGLEIVNCTVTDNFVNDISANGGDVTSINSIYDWQNSRYSGSNFIENWWYLNISVKEGATPLQGVDVTLKDIYTTSVFLSTTPASGRFEWLLVKEGRYSNTPTFDTPHNLSGSAPGYVPSYLDFTMNKSKEVVLQMVPNNGPSGPSNIQPTSTHNTTVQLTWTAAVDPDSHPITYKVNLYEGVDDTGNQMSFNSSTTNTHFNISQTLEYYKTYFVRIYAEDPYGGLSWATGTFDVVNSPPSDPVIAFDDNNPGPNQDIELRITTPSVDTDTDPVDPVSYTYVWYKNHQMHLEPHWGPITNTTVLNLTIPAENTYVGDLFEVFVTAYDGITGSNTIYSNVTVENKPPEVNQTIDDIIMNEDTIYYFSLEVVFTDSDGHDLTYGESSSSNLTITINENLSVEVKPIKDFNGEETIILSASDPFNTINEEVLVTVNPVNDPPVNRNFTFEVWDTDKNNVTFKANPAEDVDDVDLTYHWNFGDGTVGSGMDADHSYEKVNVSRDYVVTLVVSDGDLNSDICVKTVTIEAYIEPDPGDDDDDDDDIVDDDVDDDVDLNDTDADGLPDVWEMQYFDDLSQGPDGDYDNDGLSNLKEHLDGTDPTVPEGQPPDDDDDKPEESGLGFFAWLLIILGTIVVLIIVVVVVLIMRRKKTDEAVEEEGPGYVEETPPQRTVTTQIHRAQPIPRAQPPPQAQQAPVQEYREPAPQTPVHPEEEVLVHPEEEVPIVEQEAPGQVPESMPDSAAPEQLEPGEEPPEEVITDEELDKELDELAELEESVAELEPLEELSPIEDPLDIDDLMD
jgi:hypothetical protein